MSQPNDPMVESILALMAKDGVRDVANWRLPNDDYPFSENASAERFEANVESYSRFLFAAINELGGEDK